jgi:hypothetical protein
MTDTVSQARQIRKVPMGDIAVRTDDPICFRLLNYSVCPREKRGWDFKADCFGGLSIDE